MYFSFNSCPSQNCLFLFYKKTPLNLLTVCHQVIEVTAKRSDDHSSDLQIKWTVVGEVENKDDLISEVTHKTFTWVYFFLSKWSISMVCFYPLLSPYSTLTVLWIVHSSEFLLLNKCYCHLCLYYAYLGSMCLSNKIWKMLLSFGFSWEIICLNSES